MSNPQWFQVWMTTAGKWSWLGWAFTTFEMAQEFNLNCGVAGPSNNYGVSIRSSSPLPWWKQITQMVPVEAKSAAYWQIWGSPKLGGAPIFVGWALVGPGGATTMSGCKYTQIRNQAGVPLTAVPLSGFGYTDLAPRPPYASYPTASHPPARGCGPTKTLKDGQYTGRGGVFEGPTMADSDQICGFFGDKAPVVPMRGWPDVADWGRKPTTIGGMNTLPMSRQSSMVPFAPRALTTGFGAANMVPMAVRTNRSRDVWTGPLSEQAAWPDGWTPRGGILDGSTVTPPGQFDDQAFYDERSPRVVQTDASVSTLPNPMGRNVVVGTTSIGPTLAGFGADLASASSVPVRLAAAAKPEATPRRLGGPRMRPISSSVFLGPVYDGGARNDVPMTNTTPGLPMAGFGAGPDGLGGCGCSIIK